MSKRALISNMRSFAVQLPGLLFVPFRWLLLCLLLLLLHFSSQAQTTPATAPASGNTATETPAAESKLKFVNKIGHWITAYGMSGEEFVQDQRDSFKTAAFAEVYIECIIDYDTWLFNLLNRVTKLRNEEKQSPYIFFELTFKPKDATLTSYTIPTFTLKSSNTINGLDKVATDAFTKYLKGKPYTEPVQSIPDVEKAVKEVLNVLKEKLGNSLAPDLMVRYNNEFFWNGHEIDILDTEGNYVELEAINKNIQPYSPNDIVWTNADPSGSKGVVDMTGVSSKTVSYKRKRDSVAMTVNVKRTSLTDDVNEILKAAIIEALTYKKKEALDAVAQLKKDSIDNANNAALFIAQIESENFPMINDGTSLTPMFSAPLLRNDENAFINSSDKSLEVRGKTFLELKKRKTIRKAINLKLNVAAFADLVVDHPQEIQTLLNALLENSGRLVAQLILGQTGEGKRDAAKNIVVDFLNKNLESIVGNRFPDTPGEPPVVIPVTPVAAANPPVFSADKFLYINKYANFKGRDSLEIKLNNYLKGLDTALYVFINYSQDNSREGYMARAKGIRPAGLPSGARYKVFTVINIPGSLLEDGFGLDVSSSKPDFAGKVGDEVMDEPFALETMAYDFEYDMPSPEPANIEGDIFIDLNNKPIRIPKDRSVIYVNKGFPKGALFGFKFTRDNVTYKFLPFFVKSTDEFVDYRLENDNSKIYKESEFCSGPDYAGLKEIRLVTYDQANCKLIYETGTYNFAGSSGNSPTITYREFTKKTLISSKPIETDCEKTNHLLIDAQWKPIGLDLTAIDRDDFKKLMNDKSSEFALKIDNVIKSYPAAAQLYGDNKLYHLINSEQLPEEAEYDYLILEHKLQYLKQQTGIEFYVILDKVNFYIRPESEEHNPFAKSVYDKTTLLKGKKAVLVTIPYFLIGNTEKQYVMPGIYDPGNLLDANFLKNGSYNSVLKMLKSAYTWLPKPHREYAGFLNADGTVSFTERVFENGKPIAGKESIEAVAFYKNKGYQRIKDLEKPVLMFGGGVSNDPRNINPSYAFEQFTYTVQVLNILDESAAPASWELIPSKIFRENQIKGQYQNYAYHMAFIESDLKQWWTELEIVVADSENPENAYFNLDKACYNFKVMPLVDPIVYNTIDLVGLIPGVDNFADAAGLCYATARFDQENMTAYAVGVAAVGVGTVIFKYGGKSIKAIYKGSVWLYDKGSKTARKLSKVERLKGPISNLFSIADEGQLSNELVSKLQDILKPPHFTNVHVDDIIRQGSDAAKIARLEKLVALEDVIKILSPEQVSLLRRDLLNTDFLAALMDNPKLVGAWKGMQNAPDVIRKNSDILGKVDQLFAAGFKQTDVEILATGLNKLKGRSIPDDDLKKITEYALEARKSTSLWSNLNIETDLFKQIDELASSAKFKNPEDLKDFLSGTQLLQNIGDNPGNLEALNEAVRLLKQGKDIILEGKGTIKGDVVDLTNKISYQYKAFTGSVDRTLTSNLKTAAEQFVSEPVVSGYSKVAKMKILSPQNPQFSSSSKDLTIKLQQYMDANALNSTGDNLRALTEIHIENATGLHKYRIENTLIIEIR